MGALPRGDGASPRQVVHVGVWQWPLVPSCEEVGELLTTLSPDERKRAHRFVFERDRAAFIMARGRVRSILAGIVGEAPAALAFEYGEFGKPRLRAPVAGRAPSFNVTHAGDCAGLAVSWSCEPGIDIERIRPIDPGVARRFFSARENEVLGKLSGPEWALGFFRCWTRKEAYVKALGAGIGIDLSSFDVSLAPGDPPRLERIAEGSETAADWRMADLIVPAGYVGVVAARTRGASLVLTEGQLV